MTRLSMTAASIAAAFCLAWVSLGSTALAQDATPSGSAPICAGVATPEVDAVMEDAYGDGTIPGTPAAGPSPSAMDELPQGEPADAETVAAVDHVVQTWLACSLSGEELAVLALQSDRMDQGFYGMYGDNPWVFRVVLEDDAASTPEPIDLQGDIVSATDVRMLDDGRVGGIWMLQGDTAFIILTQEDGQWVVDDIIDVIDE
ncbi:MAG: hypothetical protein E6R14_06060 [Thermomicrobiales bacterium]|nr:MAG: hypothetical protein E6R14_06060 [Thermomicrobiales bacterium]